MLSRIGAIIRVYNAFVRNIYLELPVSQSSDGAAVLNVNVRIANVSFAASDLELRGSIGPNDHTYRSSQ